MLESLSSSIRILSDTMQSDKMADNTKGTCEGAVRLAFRIMLERLSSSIRSLVRALFIQLSGSCQRVCPVVYADYPIQYSQTKQPITLKVLVRALFIQLLVLRRKQSQKDELYLLQVCVNIIEIVSHFSKRKRNCPLLFIFPGLYFLLYCAFGVYLMYAFTLIYNFYFLNYAFVCVY